MTDARDKALHPPARDWVPVLQFASGRWRAEYPVELKPKQVLLACVPFQNVKLSSLAVALLATYLRENGAHCVEFYAHFELARLVGEASYASVVDGHNHSIGELMFAERLHGSGDRFERHEKLSALFGDIAQRLAILDRFEDYCLARVIAERPDILGISTSAGQLLPALWLANVVKSRGLPVKVVLGGSACSDPMGRRIKQFYPFVDCVVSGYGEEPLLALAQGHDLIDGVVVNTTAVELDRLPIPDYTAFLQQAGPLASSPGEMMLAFESSRGCWWGQKNHCTFCGLNRLEMTFKEKSSDRVVSEIQTLWEGHGHHLFATDTILSREHLRTAMPKLARFRCGPKIFYEVKANMTEAEVETLRRARVVWIQPGIESLSTSLLKLLRKGVTAIQNLALLKWCREQRIAVSWNELCAIPGEKLEDYEDQIALMKKIVHLTPPGSVHPIRIDRYSPYFNEFDKYGWSSINPLPEYQLLHPDVDEDSLQDLAYHFDGVGGVNPKLYLHDLQDAVQTWQAQHLRGNGLFLDGQAGLVRLKDGEAYVYRWSSELGRVLHCTHNIHPLQRVLDSASCSREYLDCLVEEGILYIEDGGVLNLAVRVGAMDAPSIDAAPLLT